MRSERGSASRGCSSCVAFAAIDDAGIARQTRSDRLPKVVSALLALQGLLRAIAGTK